MDAYQEEDTDYHKVDFIYAVQSIVKFGCLHKKLNVDVVKQLPFLSKYISQRSIFAKHEWKEIMIVDLQVNC